MVVCEDRSSGHVLVDVDRTRFELAELGPEGLDKLSLHPIPDRSLFQASFGYLSAASIFGELSA